MNNILYKDVIINHKEIANWKDIFVSRSVENHIILSLSNYIKYQGYKFNLSKNHLENDMNIAILDSWDFGCKDKYNKLQL